MTVRQLFGKRILYFFVIDAVLVIVAVSALWSHGRIGDGGSGAGRDAGMPIIGHMKLISSAFEDNQSIPPAFTCDGRGVPPPLAWSDIPRDAKSLALTVRDPDAPSGTWTHWTLWNVAPKDAALASGDVPEGAVQGMTSTREQGWHAPCPPFGSHRYVFTLYALDLTLPLKPDATVTDLLRVMEGHVVGEATLTGRYQRVTR
ncbi:MAG: hypothetical protein RLZZ324_55 [Candidatus Parcubacteria bacterium]|jgi:Raf kinase inhibitor-like YbhB/YbcL family protein